MKICETCHKPYEVKERLGMIFEVPTCTCASQRAAAEQEVAARDRLREVALAKFEKLGLGPVDKFTEEFKTDERWGAFVDVPSALRMPGNLIFVGAPGSRKTTSVKGIVWTGLLADPQLKVRGGKVTVIMDDLKNFDGPEGASFVREKMDWLYGGDVLVLDDLDKMKGSPYELSRLLMVIDRYWAYNRCVIVTMNHYDLQALQQTLIGKGFLLEDIDPIISRLSQNSMMIQTGKMDYRKNRGILRVTI